MKYAIFECCGIYKQLLVDLNGTFCLFETCDAREVSSVTAARGAPRFACTFKR